jgi:hypothetical protein
VARAPRHTPALGEPRGAGCRPGDGGDGHHFADGGSADGAAGAGCGGGGRIAVYYTSRAGFSGSAHAFGGDLIPAMAKPTSVGGAGTVYWKQGLQAHGDLIIDNAGRSQSVPRTRLRAVGSGVIQALAATSLEASVGFPLSDTRLEGQWVVVNGRDDSPFRIVTNTASALSTDPQSGSMTAAGAPGNPFQGAIRLNNLTVTRNGAFHTNGDLIIISGGTVTLTAGGTLTAPPVIFR